MSKSDKRLAYELFVQDLQKCYNELEHHIQFFNFYDDEYHMVEQSMLLFKELIDKLKNVDSLDEAKKYVKIKKLLDKYNLR